MDYKGLYEKLCKAQTKHDMLDALNQYGIESSTKPTLTRNKQDLYFQMMDYSRIHFIGSKIKLWVTEPVSRSKWFEGFTFQDVNDAPRTKRAEVPKTLDNFIKIMSYFIKDNDVIPDHRNPVEAIKEEKDAIEADIEKLSITGQEKQALVKVRINQGVFREQLLRKYSHCCLCGVSNPDLLIASHIKPWSEASPEEKVDVNNGLLLCPNHDRVFDRGLISFDDNGAILISDELIQRDRMMLNIDEGMSIEITDKNKEYFTYHRKKSGL